MLSFADAAVIVGLGVLLFGSQKIPELARAIRRSGREFRDGHAEAMGPQQQDVPEQDAASGLPPVSKD
ncbi:MAG: twin-arginine translocase TatA/TatE family subunit [Candidatus Sericytochromatia bacterium]|nr:twin-arginine translocase TatA/TatE family subunit [Candidatus Sericytochromatia bacterium]